MILEELGHRIFTAASGADALEQFGHHGFDLVVTDYKMPRMDGVELIRRLRKQAPDLPVILLSGYIDSLGLCEDSTGATVIIQKSAHEVGHLIRSVTRLLRKKPGKKSPASHTPPPASKRKA